MASFPNSHLWKRKCREKRRRSMSEKMNRPIAMDYGGSNIARSLTDKPPAHFTLKIDSASLLYDIIVVQARVQSYESEVFEAGGYKWKLSIYPNGDKGYNAEGYLSLYLIMADTYKLPLGWKVRAKIKFFVHDQLRNKYLTMQDANAAASVFDVNKTEFGFARLLPRCSLLNDGNGYLVNDRCVFGAEVLVENYIGTSCTVDTLAMVKAPYTWKIENFSSLPRRLVSDLFTAGNQKWKLLLYPKGDLCAKKNTLSLYLVAEDVQYYPERKIFAQFELCIVNQRGGEDMHMLFSGTCFSRTAPDCGTSTFFPLSNLHDASRGFLVYDTLIIRAQVDVFSTVRSSLKKIDLPDLHAEPLQQTKVQNQGPEKIIVINSSGIFHTGAAKARKLPQAKVKKEAWPTQAEGKSLLKKSCIEAPKGIQPRKPWFRRWFFCL